MPGDDLPMPIKIWPNDFERKEHIYAEERFLLRNALKNFKEGELLDKVEQDKYYI